MAMQKNCIQCGKPAKANAHFCANCGAPEEISPKSGVTTLLLCLFLGAFGAHRFYVGKIGTAILMILTAGGLGIWVLVDIVMIACCRFKDKLGRYVMFKQSSSSTVVLVLKTLAAVIGAFIIYAGLLVTLVFYLTSDMIDVVKNELAAIQQGKIIKAYSYTSDEFREATSREQFDEFISMHPELANYVDVSFPSREFKNDNGMVTSVLKMKDGSTQTLHFKLIKENGTWKILGMKFSKPDHDEESITENSDELKLYENKKMQISMNYPRHWEYFQRNAKSVAFSGKAGTDSYDSSVTIQQVPMNDEESIYKNVNDIVKDLKTQISEGTKSAKYLDESEAELPQPGGYKGVSMVVTYTYKGLAMKKMLFIIATPDEKKAYIWGYTTPAKLYDADLPTAKMMYESFIIHNE